jgi:hypothetical protein
MSTETKPTLTKAEELFMFYKKGMAGSGMAALIEAIWKLDRNNRAKIALGYPELVAVCNRFNDETGYWEDLQKRWNQVTQHVNAEL